MKKEQWKPVVLLEDITDWQDVAKESLSGLELECLAYESDFVARIKAWEAHPPDVFVIDFMVPWEEPKHEFGPVLDEVRENGYHRAGIRCERLLSRSEQLRAIPLVFWTVITEEDLEKEFGKKLEPNRYYISKDWDPSELRDLVNSLVRKA